jgi:hypothetical protein
MPEGETKMAFQAIVTKFIGPSNVRGARVKATAAAGSITLSWDHALGHEQNHRAAAMALATKYGWNGRYVGGGMPGAAGNVYVCDHADFPEDTFTL